MNRFQQLGLAMKVAANAAWKSGRMAYRTAGGKPVQNRYEAGRRWQFGMRSAIWSWVTDSRFDATQADRWEMMRKARYFEANSPLVQRLADLWEQYTVGANGLLVCPQSSDDEWVSAAKGWYDEWGAAPDLCSLHGMATLQSLASRLWFIDGEVFILKTRSLKPPYRPRIQLLESHRVGTPSHLSSAEGLTIVDGVQLDAKGKPIFYWVRDDFNGNEYRPIAAENIIHIFEPSRVGMYRGLTHFYAVMNPLHDLDDLMLLEMGAAKDAAKTQKVVKRASGEAMEDDWDDEDKAQGSATDGDGESEKKSSHSEYYERVFGSETKFLFEGDEYEQFVSNRPSVAQQWYWKFLIEQVCSGVGIPMLMVYPDTMQGTVYRGVLDTAAGFFRARSKVMQDAFRDVWRYAIDFGARVDVRIADRPVDWQAAMVRPPRSANVDVGRQSAAMLAEVEAGLRTFASVYGETGDDWQEQLTQRAKEVKFIDTLAKKYAVPPQLITRFALDQLQAQAAQQPQNQNRVRALAITA